jgi:hypothetical protein
VSAAPGPTSPTDARPPAPAAGTPAAQFFAALKAKNPDYNSTGDFTWQDGKLIGADLRACGLRDLSPLAGQPLVTLVCVENDVEDLTPLRGMPLTHLAISSTKVRDLSPLKGMPLKSLVITMLDLDDVSVLKDLPLERLFFSPDRIKGDFSFLRNHKTLKHMGTAHLYYTVESFWRWWDSGGRPFRPPSPPPGGGYPRSPTYETAKASLQKTAKFQIREKTIGYVVDAIAKSAGMRVEVSPACQDAVGAAVTLEAPSLTLEEALNRVLEPHGLGFDIPRDGVILIVRTPMPMP